MAGDKKFNIAWDSCVFLAWFKQETDKPLEDIALILSEVAKGRITLFVSALCAAEVLDEAGVSDAGDKFRDYVRRPNVALVNVDMRIAERAAKFRERARDEVKAGRSNYGIKAPDAIIAATAAVYRVPVLHSFDPVLNHYSETPILDGLKVCPPIDPRGQRALTSGAES